MKNDDQHCTPIAIFWSKQPVLCQSTELAFGILLDQKCLYKSVHAAIVNTKWHGTWLEGALFVDPIIHDVQGAGVLSRTQGQPCNCHRKTHLLFRVFVVVLSLITSRWVAAAAAGSARSDVFFHSFQARCVATTQRILCWSQRSLVVSHSLLVKRRHCL